MDIKQLHLVVTAYGKPTDCLWGKSTDASAPLWEILQLPVVMDGKLNNASGQIKAPLWDSTDASEMNSMPWGLQSIAAGYGSTAMGDHTIVSESNSTAMGNGTNALVITAPPWDILQMLLVRVALLWEILQMLLVRIALLWDFKQLRAILQVPLWE